MPAHSASEPTQRRFNPRPREGAMAGVTVALWLPRLFQSAPP